MTPIETRTIEEVTETLIDYRGKTPPKSDDGVRLITAKVIKNGRIQDNRTEYITDETYDAWMRRGFPRQWDILVTTEAPLGEVAQLRTAKKIALAQRVILLRGDESVINQQYYFQSLKSPFVQAGLQQRATGTTVLGIKQSELRQVKIPYYPLPTQHKIASILSAYDDLIENNLRRIKILEEIAQNLYREWFVKFRFPGDEQARFKDSPLGRIPEGWEVTALADLVKTQYGFTESAQEESVGPRFLRGKDINKTTYIDWSEVPYCPIPDDQFPKYRLAEGDIVVIRMADPGKVGIVERAVSAVFASYLVRLTRVSNSIGPYYLFHFLIDERYQGYITGVSTGTTRKSASAGVLTGIDLAVPPKPVLDAFESQVSMLRRLLNNLLERNATLRQTRDLLLPKLISGDLDVSNLDIRISDV